MTKLQITFNSVFSLMLLLILIISNKISDNIEKNSTMTNESLQILKSNQMKIDSLRTELISICNQTKRKKLELFKSTGDCVEKDGKKYIKTSKFIFIHAMRDKYNEESVEEYDEYVKNWKIVNIPLITDSSNSNQKLNFKCDSMPKKRVWGNEGGDSNSHTKSIKWTGTVKM